MARGVPGRPPSQAPVPVHSPACPQGHGLCRPAAAPSARPSARSICSRGYPSRAARNSHRRGPENDSGIDRNGSWACSRRRPDHARRRMHQMAERPDAALRESHDATAVAPPKRLEDVDMLGEEGFHGVLLRHPARIRHQPVIGLDRGQDPAQVSVACQTPELGIEAGELAAGLPGVTMQKRPAQPRGDFFEPFDMVVPNDMATSRATSGPTRSRAASASGRRGAERDCAAGS